MSYAKFNDDLNEFYKDRRVRGITESIHPDKALAAIRDKWMQQDRIRELIVFVHTNWDSGNCDDFIEPLDAFLIKSKQADTYRHLWKKIINYRLNALWRSVNDLKRQTKNIVLPEITSIDISNFDMHSRDSYTNIKRVVAFRRQFAIDGLTKMQNGLQKMDQIKDAADIQKIIDDIKLLKRPKLKL